MTEKTIWKKTLLQSTYQEIEVPEGARIIHVDTQISNDQDKVEYLCVWFECDPLAKPVGMKLWIFGTGHRIQDALYPNLQHLGTAIMRRQGLVWHIYIAKDE